MTLPGSLRRTAMAGLGLLLLTGPSQAAPPDEDDCPAVSSEPDGPGGADAAPLLLEEGMTLDYGDVLALRQVLPDEIWQHREIFFHEGMAMEIGPCHRRYSAPDFFTTATRRYRGQAHVDDEGNLVLNHPGLPFPPDQIAEDDEQAAVKWAWNLERRYRGAAPRGSFRITDLPGRIGGIQVYIGEFYYLQLQNRSDLAARNYELANAENNLWVGGGRFTEPFNARHLAWRQFRPEGTLDDYDAADDIFVYVPEMRKMRRAASTWTDGLFFPRYSVSTGGGGGGLPFGGGSVNATAGQSISVSQDSRTALTGLSLRPNAYVWRIRGTQDVLAPINSARTGYPQNPNRNFGPSGLSVASDRWDVRHAVIIEGAARKKDETVRTLTVYVDYLTQLPLFWITRADRRRLVEIGVLVHRFSAEVPNYPNFPGDVPADVFEPVAASFFNALEGLGGWRRESYDLVSTPVSADEQRRMTATDVLTRGR